MTQLLIPGLTCADQDAEDFVLQTAAEHGLPELVNPFGVESTRLTAAWALPNALPEAFNRGCAVGVILADSNFSSLHRTRP